MLILQLDKLFQGFFNNLKFLKSQIDLVYINFEKKKNHISAIAFNPEMIPKNIYANFFPINAVSGSSFTLIKFSNYCRNLTL